MIKLAGILLIAIGFALRFNPLVVVLAAGIATGLCAGMSFPEILTQFGQAFVDNRFMTLPVVLIVPVIGLLERHGLKEYAERCLKKAKAATAGRVLLLYTAMRQISIALGVNIGGHAGAVRPLIAPMAEGAARTRHGAVPEETAQAIRAHAAAAENVGNFFGEDVFIAVGAVLLMKSFFDAEGMPVSVWALALWGLPTAAVAFAAMVWRCRTLDRRIARECAPEQGRAP